MKNILNKIYLSRRSIILLPLLLFLNSCEIDRTYGEPLLLSFTRSGDIWLMDINGQSLRQITATGNNDSSSWSPDCTKIVFQSSRDGNDEIFIMNPDGSGQKQLTFTSGADYCRCPTFMPDGENIVFFRMVNPVPYFFIIKTDGTFVKQVSAPSGILNLTVSPDGRFIASMDGPNQISRTNVETGLQEVFVSPSSRFNPSWSPDGKYVALISGSNVSLIDTSAALPVTPADIYAFTGLESPVWTPDSGYLYFIQNSNICRITISGADFIQLTSSSSDSNPCVQGKPR
ncbi:MAG TPA: hypothetical protein PKG60_03415 [Spirochaetota bacterium]|nr:hypothetical protein [Spirochaetota bacterium]HPS87094.1 hypothetical protein [Spirochaetota bacterium]